MSSTFVSLNRPATLAFSWRLTRLWKHCCDCTKNQQGVQMRPTRLSFDKMIVGGVNLKGFRSISDTFQSARFKLSTKLSCWKSVLNVGLVGASSLLGPSRLMFSFFQTQQEQDEKETNSSFSTFTQVDINASPTSMNAYEPDDPRLKSSECLKNAAGLSVDSTSAVLSQTVYAIIKIEDEYVQLIDVLIKLLDYQLQVLGHEKEEARMAELITETRSEIEKVSQRKQDLSILFSSAEKLAEASAEVAFITGCDYASTSIGERLHSAQMEVKKVHAKSAAADERLRQAQVNSIEKISKHAKEQEKLKKTENIDVTLSLDIDNLDDADSDNSISSVKHDDQEKEDQEEDNLEREDQES